MEKPLKCGLGRHKLREPWTKLTDAGQISAVRRARPQFRPDFKVCKSCFDDVVRIYNKKLKSAKNIAMQKRSALKNGSTSNPSITTITSTTPDITNSTSSNSHIDDSFDRMVHQTPRNPTLQSTSSDVEAKPRWMTHSQPAPSNKSPIVQTEPVTLDYSDSTDSSSHMLVSQTSLQQTLNTLAVTPPIQMASTSASTRQAPRASTEDIAEDELNTSEAVTPSIQMASTSASTSSSIRQASRASTEDVSEDDVDRWENIPSPAVLSGVRLPHIQPIARRREFQHPDPRVMDIYLARLTGG